jgi:hypothetical protein
MNEPKRRGRPPKVKAISEPHINGDDSRQPEDVLPVKAEGVVVPGKDALVTAYEAAQAYALRVWSGQSETIPRKERLVRVARALEGQGLSMEGVEL